MFKILIFAKKRAELSRGAFIAAYENVHVPLSTELANRGKIPHLLDYRRNFILHDSPFNIGSAVDFDVVTEAIFADEAAFHANRTGLSDPEVAKIVGEDLAAFLDVATMRYVVVEEYRGGVSDPAAAA
jgi:hypothetical protein